MTKELQKEMEAVKAKGKTVVEVAVLPQNPVEKAQTGKSEVR